MNLSDLLHSDTGSDIVQNIASQFGIDQQQAAAVVQTAVPLILGGIGRNVQTPQGADALNNALEAKHDGSILDNLGSFFSQPQAATQDGQGILNHVFGSQVSNVEEGVAQKSGISMQKIGPIIAMLAPLVLAYLGKQKQQNTVSSGSGLTDLIGQLIGGGQQAQSSSGGGLMGLVSGFLDKNKDGSVLDDIVGMFGKK